MDKATLLQFCKYYHGEEECPYHEDVKRTLWIIEHMWVDFYNHDPQSFIGECIQDYIAIGLGSFCQTDDTPLPLKALLFNRLTKYAERQDVDAFKTFYKKYYS